jgi:hypothetical protein
MSIAVEKTEQLYLLPTLCHATNIESSKSILTLLPFKNAVAVEATIVPLSAILVAFEKRN